MTTTNDPDHRTTMTTTNDPDHRTTMTTMNVPDRTTMKRLGPLGLELVPQW